jgi:adenosine deaminase
MYKHILHDHLDGGLRPETCLEIAKSCNYLPLLEVDDVANFFNRSNSESLEDYLEAFTHTIALMQSYENLERIAYEAAVDMHNNNINYYESRYAPFYSVNEQLTPLDVINAINSGFKLAENEFGIVSGLILCGMRHDANNVITVADLAVEHKELIIGFDIAGPELGFMPSLFKDSFKKVIENNINVTIHAGEGAGVDSIQDALDNGAKRIGHGVRIIEDIDIEDNKLGKVANYIVENQIPLEVCITSNLHTNMFKNLEDHPINKLIELDFNISLNTDNRLMSNTSVNFELENCKLIGIKNPESLLNFSASDSFFE